MKHFGDPGPKRLPSYGFGDDDPIIYINGVDTTDVRSAQTAKQIAEMEHRRVIPIWNPPTSFVSDLLQTAVVNKTNVPDATTLLLISTIREELNVSRTVTIVSHSQGSAITSSALHYLSASERQHISVITLGGAALSYPKGLKSLRVIVNIKDQVPWLAGYSAAYGPIGGPPELERVNFGTWGDFAEFNTDVTHNVSTYVTMMHGILARERARARMQQRR